MEDLVMNALTDTEEKTVENLSFIKELFTTAMIPETDKDSEMYNECCRSILYGAKACKMYVEKSGIDASRELVSSFYGYLDQVREDLQKIGMLK